MLGIRSRKRTRLGKFDIARSQLGSFSQRDFEFFFADHFSFAGQTLYHYTRQDALFAMLSNNNFWLSHIEHLNDVTEYAHAHEVLGEILSEFGKSSFPQEKAFVQELSASQYKATESLIFVLCFSRKCDDLNQWRSYASPGNGFCVGYQAEALNRFAEYHKAVSGACVYSRDIQNFITKELVARFIADIEGYFPFYGPGEINEDLISGRCATFWKYFHQIAPLFKHPAFAEEDEIRVIIRRPIDTQELLFRSGPGSIVPYISIRHSGDGAPDLVPTIILVKPNPNIEFLLRSTEFFLKQKGYLSTEIRASNIPYREPLQR